MAEQEFQTDIVDSERAMRENQAFMDGKWKDLKKFPAPPIVMEAFAQMGQPLLETEVYIHDDHVVHLESHTNLLKSEDTESWPEEQFKALDKHVMVHLIYQQSMAAPNQLEQQQAQNQAAAQQAQNPTENMGGAEAGRPVEGEGAGMGQAIEGGNPDTYQ